MSLCLLATLFAGVGVAGKAEAAAFDLPFKLAAPSNVSVSWLEGGDSPTTMNLAWSMADDQATYMSKANDDEDYKKTTLNALGYDNLYVNIDVDWAIDDKVNGWHHTKYWDYPYINQFPNGNDENDDGEKHYWLHVGRTILKDWRLYLMLIPMILVFLFWRYFPMYELLGSFKVSDEVKPVAEQLFSGFSYFKRLLVGGDGLSTEFWRAFRNTFLLSFYGLCFGFPMPIILALFFNEIKSNIVRSTCQVLTYLPKFMSTVVMTTLVTMLVKQGSLISGMGIVSQALTSIGILPYEIANAGLLNNPNFFRAIYQISGIWEGAGYDSIVYFAAIIAISPTSYEAAQIDGADKMAQMRYVVLPSILSTIVIMLITRIGSLLNIGYEKVLLLYNPNTYVTADVVSTFANRYGLEGAAKGIASAAEMMNNVIGMLLVIGANTIARKASDVSLY